MVREGKQVNEKEERWGQMGEGNGERLRGRTKREEKGVERGKEEKAKKKMKWGMEGRWGKEML